MNNSDDSARYVEALARLYGSDKMHVCKHPACQTITLKDYCIKHDSARKQINESKRRSQRRGRQ